MAFGKKWKNRAGTPVYYVWRDMRRRCSNPKADSWHRYGGRGIKVCDAWENDYDNFFEWAIDNGYKEGLSIERKDFNGNYEPDNCTWITMYEQHSNESRNVFIEHNGEVKTMAQWCREIGFSEITARKRHCKYGANTYEEIFCDHLRRHRTGKRANKCVMCQRDESIKWRKDGILCNTCYHKALRWSKSNKANIGEFPEWANNPELIGG
jgi:hypothetical protein